MTCPGRFGLLSGEVSGLSRDAPAGTDVPDDTDSYARK